MCDRRGVAGLVISSRIQPDLLFHTLPPSQFWIYLFIYASLIQVSEVKRRSHTLRYNGRLSDKAGCRVIC